MHNSDKMLNENLHITSSTSRVFNRPNSILIYFSQVCKLHEEKWNPKDKKKQLLQEEGRETEYVRGSDLATFEGWRENKTVGFLVFI